MLSSIHCLNEKTFRDTNIWNPDNMLRRFKQSFNFNKFIRPLKWSIMESVGNYSAQESASIDACLFRDLVVRESSKARSRSSKARIQSKFKPWWVFLGTSLVPSHLEELNKWSHPSTIFESSDFFYLTSCSIISVFSILQLMKDALICSCDASEGHKSCDYAHRADLKL